MWIILGMMAAGGIAGFFLAGRKSFNPLSEKITTLLVYFLLFFMGLSVGVNREIMSDFRKLGLEALLITFFTISGSIGTAWILHSYFLKNIPGRKPEKQDKK